MTLLQEVRSDMRHQDADGTPVLRPRSQAVVLRDLVARGQVGQPSRP
jgi:hypothetical protein